VEILPLGREGILLDSPVGAKKVRVQMGNQILVISPESIEGVAQEAEKAPEAEPDGIPPPRAVSPVASELHLHGQRVEEGLNQLERFLDRATLSEEREVRVVHGHGSGKLKKAIRDYLKSAPYVERFRPGDLWEGGDGVTVVTLYS
jgi:DNA mismatch repair protein MutS2